MKKNIYFYIILILLLALSVNFNINSFYLGKILVGKESMFEQKSDFAYKYSENFDVFKEYDTLSIKSINIQDKNIIIQGKIEENSNLNELEYFITKNNSFELKEISSFRNEENMIETQFELKYIK
jgi:hypothetical protein